MKGRDQGFRRIFLPDDARREGCPPRGERWKERGGNAQGNSKGGG